MQRAVVERIPKKRRTREKEKRNGWRKEIKENRGDNKNERKFVIGSEIGKMQAFTRWLA